QYTRRARIAQSSDLPTAADEPASPLGDDSQGEACHTVSGLEAEQDRANIIKISTFPHDSTPRVTSLAADEGSMQHKLNELIDLCTRLQRQQTEMASKIAAQELEITSLKASVKLLEDKDGGGAEPSGEDATIKGRSLETGEEVRIKKSTERGSNDTEELVNVLTSLDAASILTSGVQMVSVPPAAEVATVSVPTGSGMVPTTSPIFTTTSVVTPYSRRKGKEKMVESDTPKKKLQEQIDVQVAREMEKQIAREDQRRNEQITRDAEIARIHAEEELQMMIDGREDRVDQIISEISRPSLKDSKVPSSTKQASLQEATKRILYVNTQESFGMENQALQRLEQESPKKMKTVEDVSEEDLKQMMQLVQVEVYVEALQVKHPIIDWEIHTEGQRTYWKIIRLEGSTTVYQFFVDMLKYFDKEDLNQLWNLDFQDSPNDEEDTRSIHEYLNDLEEEYQARDLLAKYKRFFKKGNKRFSSAKITDQTKCHKCGKKGYFARDCWSKASIPSYQLPFQPTPLSSSQHKPKLRFTKDFKVKYNKVKAKLALLSSSASALKVATVKNKGLITEAYKWDKEELSSDDNEMVEVKVLMELAEENDVISKEGARNGEWVKISMRNFWAKRPSLCKSSADDTKVSIPGVERPWLSEAKGFIMPNHDTGRILPAELQRNTTDPPFSVTDSLMTDYDSVDESSIGSTPLPPLKKLDGAEHV
nr:hypothetical protein [Tanacetum cinerariifolium]